MTARKKLRFLHYEFDKSKADRAVNFVQNCCFFSKGKFAGKPFKLRPWQRNIIEQIFGWVDSKTGLRRYRKVFIFLPRKNGKSHLAAAIALYMLYADGEAGAEVVLAANSREQASIVYGASAGMVRQSPVLSKLSTLTPSTKRILVKDSESILKTVSADAPTSLGLDISCLVYDEIAFALNRDLYDALTTGSGSRLQPLHCFITTAGWDVEGIGHQLYQYAKTILADPSADPTFLAIIFEVPEGANWSDPKLQKAANPALGEFLSLETMKNAAREAVNKPSEQNKFRMFNCNQWVQAAESWLNRAKWDLCADPSFDERALKGLPFYVSLDLSSNQDITALVALWVDAEHQKYHFKPFLFLPGDDLRERSIRDHVPYQTWAEQGHILTTPGATVDYAFIKRTLKNLAEWNSVKAVGYDPWHAHQLIGELEADGFNCVQIRQGHQSLAAPTKEFESLIVSQHLVHDANPCMSWMVENVVVRLDQNGNMVPDKRKSKHRIDGISAAVGSLACAMRLEVQEPPKKKTPFRISVFGI